MNPVNAQRLARELIQAHGLVGWTFSWDRAVKRLGACHYHTRQITLSYDLTVKAPDEEIKNVILHEIAHALAGHKAGHGPEWVRVAQSIGCSGTRCYDVASVGKIDGKWKATCQSCGREYRMHRLKTRTKRGNSRRWWCTPCGEINGHLTWEET